MDYETDIRGELKHYGVLGMRWGVHKTGANLTGQKNKTDDEVKEKRKKMSQVRRHISDLELREAVERLQTEKKLKELTDDDISPGKSAAKKILSQVGKSTITAVATAVATYSVKAAMEGKFDIKEAAKFIRPKK